MVELFVKGAQLRALGHDFLRQVCMHGMRDDSSGCGLIKKHLTHTAAMALKAVSLSFRIASNHFTQKH